MKVSYTPAVKSVIVSLDTGEKVYRERWKQYECGDISVEGSIIEQLIDELFMPRDSACRNDRSLRSLAWDIREAYYEGDDVNKSALWDVISHFEGVVSGENLCTPEDFKSLLFFIEALGTLGRRDKFAIYNAIVR